MNRPDARESAPTLPYTLLRASLELFRKAPAELDEQQLLRAKRQAQREHEIETRVLCSGEAAGVIIGERELDLAMQEIRSRYADDDAFRADLARNHLDEGALRDALLRQCQVDAVLERVAARAPRVSDVEVGIFYHSHLEKFHTPERREACHILISVNADFPENTRASARARIEDLARRLSHKPHKFESLAQRHSECPTALQGGYLGVVPRGQLYPEIDAVLFTLRPGEISTVVETEMGFHILLCKNIHRAETVSLERATPSIRKMMQERYRRTCQRAWIASLPKPTKEAQPS